MQTSIFETRQLEEDYTSALKAIDILDQIVQKNNERGASIPILQEIQSRFGYVAPSMLQRVSDLTGTPVSELYSITTFYSQFRLQRPGEHMIRICCGTACHLGGSELIAQVVEKVTGAKEGTTSPDGKFSLERVACLGCCSLAPVMMINGDIYGRLTPEKARKIINRLKEN